MQGEFKEQFMFEFQQFKDETLENHIKDRPVIVPLKREQL